MSRWLMSFSLLAVACGGSASETPPPAPPSLAQLTQEAERDAADRRAEYVRGRKVRHPKMPVITDRAAPAPRTWGSDDVRLK